MEKEQPDSMATVAIKPDYPPSEYSASEPPPAYRRPMSSAVQIARIAAFTIVASSCILGAFILASSWVSARAGCQQLEQLDAMLDKELALEGRSYGNDALVADEPLPVSGAHALHGAPPPPPSLQPPAPAPGAPEQKKPVSASHTGDALNQAETKLNEDKLQKLDGDKDDSPDDSSDESESASSDSNEDEDDLDAMRAPVLRLPIQFDLDDLAGAFLANNNQKGRMNCVVERRREEVLEKRFPFNILGAFGAKPEPAERIAIICHGDDKPVFPEPAAQVFAFPLSGPSRLPLRPMPPAALQPPAPMQPSHRAAPFPMPMPWDSSEDMGGSPREMRIHVQRIIAIPSPHNMPQAPEPNMIPFSRQPQEGPFSRDMRPQDMPFPRDMRPQDMPFPRDMRPQNMPFSRNQDMPFARPQDMPFPRPHDMPFPRPQEIPFPRPQEIPFPRPQEIPFPRPQEIPFPRPQENMQFQRPQETVIAFPRQEPQENMMPFPQPQQQQQPQQGEQNEQSTVMHQFVPQPPQSQEIEQPEKIQMESMGMPMGLPWGLTPETLRAIHRHAVEADQQQGDSDAEQQQIDNDMQEVKTIVNSLAAAAAAEAEGESDGTSQSQEGSTQNQDAPAQNAPIHLDAPVLIEHESPPEERPHYVQPRSVRSVDALSLHREKRVKRCSCDCA